MQIAARKKIDREYCIENLEIKCHHNFINHDHYLRCDDHHHSSISDNNSVEVLLGGQKDINSEHADSSSSCHPFVNIVMKKMITYDIINKIADYQ